jgi:hypothetical protein
MPQNRPKSKKRLLDVHTISHGRRIFAHIQVGGFGGSGGWGKAAKQSENQVATKTLLFIHRLSVSQASERFLPEVKNVEFCILILKSVIKVKSAQF